MYTIRQLHISLNSREAIKHISKRNAFLYFSEAPEIEDGGTSLTILEGEEGLLPCLAHGIPEPTVRWYKVSTELTTGADYEITVSNTSKVYNIAFCYQRL